MSKSRTLLKGISLGLLLVVVTAIPVLTQSDKGEKKPEAGKKATVREAVTKKSASTIEAKAGFELVQKGESEFEVRRASTKEVLGSVKCGICPGGRCHAKIIGPSGACRGCGSSTGRDCNIDPF